MTVLREGTPEQAGMRSKQIALIRQRGAEWAAQDNTLGLVLLAARHGVICLHEAWGQTNRKPDARPVTTDSYFFFDSNAKVIAAAAAMMLVEEGRLGLTRPVNFYVPELSAPGTDEILVQHLLTHTSGYDGDETGAQIAALLQEGIDLPSCPRDLHPALHASLHALYQLKPHTAPGTEMSYASENYLVLGEIIRRISGMSYGDFIEQRIFRPLELRNARLGLDASFEEDAVWDFSLPVMEGGPEGDELRQGMRVPNPAWAIWGQAREYAAFAQMLLNEGCYGGARLLHPASVAHMTRNQIPGIGTNLHDEARWGYGTSVIDTERWRWFHGSLVTNGSFTHGGAGGTVFWVDPILDLVGVYFSHCIDRDPELRWDGDLFQNMVTAAVA